MQASGGFVEGALKAAAMCPVAVHAEAVLALHITFFTLAGWRV
jgi:hypothetical protein